ncbi:hypothetical protein QS713_03265 [Gleimia hominis]|uniref:Uncharacterized protein n=1 Tax=Gleimia hominis TaxID=595468 RepID=A0ABU3I9N5_9ACTO|nr:hypothetical protein [Gleimia hominis]MDT3767087.1 hypothetical protein [Gleimia hominis]
MAATALGYLNWGIEENQSNYGLGDLGGWPLDLLQIWGAYQNKANSADLYAWINSHLGNVSDGQGFGYADVLADADAWLIAKYMKLHPGEHQLSQAMAYTFKQSETNRIRRFYRERFAASADNLVLAFQTVSNGIDALGLTNIVGTAKLLEIASHASSLPDAHEAETLARAYAAFIASPHR